MKWFGRKAVRATGRPFLFAGWRGAFAARALAAVLRGAGARGLSRQSGGAAGGAAGGGERRLGAGLCRATARRGRRRCSTPAAAGDGGDAAAAARQCVRAAAAGRGRRAGGAVRAAARAGERRGGRGGLAGGLSLQGRRGDDAGSRRGTGWGGRASSTSRPRIRSTTIMGWAASARRRRRSRCTMRRRNGTRRCSTMRRGLRARWSTIRATARRCRPSSSSGCSAEMEAQFAGAANAGRPLLLDGGLKWQAMSLTPGRHGLRRAEGGGGARDRAGLRGAADAARPAGRRDLRQLPRGEPGAVAADRAADGGADPARAFGERWRPGGRGCGSRSTSTR